MNGSKVLRGWFLAVALMVVAGGPARAQATEPAQRAFIDRYVATLKAQDLAGLKRLFHPAVLACATDSNRDYFDFIFGKELALGRDLATGYRITRIDAVAGDGAAAMLLPGILSNPVAPTHEFQLDTGLDDRNRSMTLIRTIAPEQGAWFVVTGCPTEKGIEFFRQRQAEGEKQQAQAKQLAAALSEPLLSELKSMLAGHRRIDAIKHYRSVTDVDLTTAKQVIDVLDQP